MPRPRTSNPDPLSSAVYELRRSVNETQQQFAQSIGTAIATVARWETTRPPKGKQIAMLMRFAQSRNLKKSVARLRKALLAELGLESL